jgi:phage baseplate assembly protein gpV
MMSDLSKETIHRIGFNEFMKGVFTAIPGFVTAFNPATQRAQVQIGITRVDSQGNSINPKPISDVPVCFSGDAYSVEYQISPGCEGMILFSQRNIDAWKLTGGIADNPSARFHNAQDAVFIPGIRSLGKTIKSFQNNGMRLRNADGTQYLWLKNDQSVAMGNANGTMTINADGSQSMINASGSIQLLANGNAVINGVIITPAGRITTPAGGGITGSNGVSFENHGHTGVTTGSGTSGGPVN